MHYIRSTPTDNGNYGNPLSQKFPGALYLPDNLLNDYIATMGFARLSVENGEVTAVEKNREAYNEYIANLPAEPEPTPTQLRETAYNTERLIRFDGETLTVTEAAQKWQYYAAEDNEKADELTTLIRAVKAAIRARYPD